jgi:hypothetical protein
VNIDDNLALSIKGKFFRTARIKDEPYISLQDPAAFIAGLKSKGVRADLFTFMQEITDREPKYPFHFENQHLAVLSITTYEDWFEEKIGFRPRNKIRKARKMGVQLRPLEFNDECVRGIMGIYNESPLIQKKPNWHYGKDFATMKKMLGTFLDRSEFVGAFFNDEMIGFIKLVRGNGFADLMHIISKNAHRDKSPTNALIAKAVEICAERKLSYLQYGIWSRRGLGVFKESHCFACLAVPRFFVPLNLKGRLMLKLGLHRKFREYVPDKWWDTAVAFRDKWNDYRYRSSATKAVAE